MKINKIPNSALINMATIRSLQYDDEVFLMTDSLIHYRLYLCFRDYYGRATKISSLYEDLLSKLREKSRIIKNLKEEKGYLYQSLSKQNRQLLKITDEGRTDKLDKAMKVAEYILEKNPEITKWMEKKEEEE